MLVAWCATGARAGSTGAGSASTARRGRAAGTAGGAARGAARSRSRPAAAAWRASRSPAGTSCRAPARTAGAGATCATPAREYSPLETTVSAATGPGRAVGGNVVSDGIMK